MPQEGEGGPVEPRDLAVYAAALSDYERSAQPHDVLSDRRKLRGASLYVIEKNYKTLERMSRQ